MASQSLSLELNKTDLLNLQQLISKMEKGVSTLEPFFDAVEMHMIDSLTQNFESGGRPQKWHPLAPMTIKLKGSSGILQDKGHLKGSINASNTEKGNLSLKIWAGEKHGLYHQYIDQDPMDQFGMTSKGKNKMPMRPFILFQDEDIKEIEQILVKFIDDVMKR